MSLESKLKKIASASFLPLAFSLMASEASGASVSLAWDPSPSPDAVKYAIYYRPSSSAQFTRKVSLTTTNTVNGLLNNVTYLFHVVAVDRNNEESVPSNQISYAPGGININDNTAPGITVTNARTISDLYPKQMQGSSPRGSIQNPFLSNGFVIVEGLLTDDISVTNCYVQGPAVSTSNTYFDYYLPSSKYRSYITGNRGTNSFQIIATDYSGNKRTNSYYLADLRGYDNNHNGMSDSEEIERGINPFMTYSKFIDITKSANNNVNIVFSAISTQPYYILSSQNIAAPANQWNIINPNFIQYSTNLNGERTGYYSEISTNDQKYYNVLDTYDFVRRPQ